MEYFSKPELLESPPVKRAAYSDRMAWIMAELARLVYDQLPAEMTSNALLEKVKKAVTENDDQSVLQIIAEVQGASTGKGQSELEQALQRGGLEFLESFAKNGTEAMLVKLSPKGDYAGMLVVVFRGTQPNIKDVSTDIKTDLVDARGGGRVHRGFIEAFDLVEDQIKQALDKHKGPPVYFCGHSLGGALAVVATRYIGSDTIGATYTFGGPRVANAEFFKSVKTPVYRVVNAADAVPRVPFGIGIVFLLWLVNLLPYIGGKCSEFLRDKIKGYTHHGNLVYLTALSKPGSYDEVSVRKSPNYFFVVFNAGKRLLTNFKAGGDDHRMVEYCSKLLAYAVKRQRS